MASSQTLTKLTGFPPTLPNVPPNYPTKPTPGKIQLLLNSNSNYLYHRFSPYTNYHDSVLASVLSNQQPFVYTFIDKPGTLNSLPQTAQSAGDIVGINQDSVDDVTRVSKFLISSWGVQFLITQAAIQRLAPFDETRIYNPLSPALATVYPLTLGLGNRPVRHIEGGLLGLANSVTSTVGINLQSGFQTPSSTVGNAALPTINTGQGKGLIRGSDAAKGASSFQSKWAPASSQNSSGLGTALNNFATSVKDSFNAFFGSAPKSKGIFRSDEEGYKIMAAGFTNLFQPWFASATNQIGKPVVQNKSTLGVIGSTATTGGSTVFIKQKLISLPDTFNYIVATNGVKGLNISDNLGGSKPTGYTSGNKYGDVVGRQPTATSNDLTNSDMLVQFSYYVNEANNYPSKLSDPLNVSVIEMNKSLQRVVESINFTSKTYNATSAVLSGLLPSALLSEGGPLGYNQISTKNDLNLNNGQKSIREEYKYGSPGVVDTTIPKSIDNIFKSSGNTSLRMATTFLSDGINQLSILGGNRKFNTTGEKQFPSIVNSYPEWTEYRPYDDDLIAFFFYDVVNDKYIPFRATVKGINEAGTANWDPLRFIGRADQLYSYNGFSRTLSFTFNIVINSVSELLPSWKKINYIASAIKPSNYTTGQKVGESFNRFMVPPMFMLTIGDLYKFQPIILTSIQVMIPDDAVWETLNEDNSPNGWSYLNGLITARDLDKNYGQLPREIQISITCDLLEKERAIVGGSNFGHEPRIDDWENVNPFDVFVTGSVSYLPIPTTLHKGFVEWNNPGSPGVEKSRASTTPSTPFILTTPVAPIPSNASSFVVPNSLSNVNNVANSPAGYTITKQGTTFNGI